MKGRKRHLLVDTNGFVMHVLVHEANIQNHNGGKDLLRPLKERFPRLQLIWADSGYKKGGFILMLSSEMREAHHGMQAFLILTQFGECLTQHIHERIERGKDAIVQVFLPQFLPQMFHGV